MARPWIEFNQAIASVARFLRDHATVLTHISETASQVFEAIVIVRLAETYEQLGFAVSVVGRSGNTFRFKFSTRGNPSRYSRFHLSKGGSEFVLCHNLSVRGKH